MSVNAGGNAKGWIFLACIFVLAVVFSQLHAVLS